MELRGIEGEERNKVLAELFGALLGLGNTNKDGVPPTNDETATPGNLNTEFDQEWLTVQAACEYIHVSRATLYRLVKEGKMPSYRIRSRILINKEALDKCIKDGLLA